MLPLDTIARIKACRGVYTLGDTARHFHVSKDTVHNIWSGKRHTRIAEAPEPPNVITARVSPDVIKEDGRTLLERGMSINEAAVEIGVSPNTLRKHIKEEAPVLLLALGAR